MAKMFIIGIAGPTSSGKSTFAGYLKEELGEKVVLIRHDSYYRDQSEKSLSERKKTNYDTPAALETDLLVKHLKALQKGKSVNIPVYDFATHNRSHNVIKVSPGPIVIVEGIFLLWEKELRKVLELKIFIDVATDVRLARRIKRDIKERGRSLDFVLYQWFKFVKPGEEKYVYPTKKYADVIVPVGGENKKALEVVLGYLKNYIL